jgi:hypothetical protein
MVAALSSAVVSCTVGVDRVRAPGIAWARSRGRWCTVTCCSPHVPDPVVPMHRLDQRDTRVGIVCHVSRGNSDDHEVRPWLI